MKQILIRKGISFLVDVDEPALNEYEVKVKVDFSCVSLGTELTSKKNDKKSIVYKIVHNPALLKRAISMIRAKNFNHVIFKLREKQIDYKAYGYSAAGTVVSVGSKIRNLKVGDKVACGGGGYAFHAEVIVVPENLTVKLTPNFPMHIASTVSIGAIALQGVRQLNPTYGECVLVVGLGLIGQITCQILKSNGCRVVGIDVNQKRLDIANQNGVWKSLLANESLDYETIAKDKYPFGVDGVIITASNSSSDIINNSFKACRKKAKVVIVGDVGLNIDRNFIYEKELEIKISTSYGPGRYEHKYEQLGYEFPISHVRWTEQRNMSEYIDSIAENKICIDNIVNQIIQINKSDKVLENKIENTFDYLTLIYDFRELHDNNLQIETFQIKYPSLPNEQTDKYLTLNAAIIGTGSFFKNVALNVLLQNKNLNIIELVSKNSISALNIKNLYNLNSVVSTNIDNVMSNPFINTVFIYTKHNLHSELILQSLKCRKNVFCEKPMSLNEIDLNLINDFYSNNAADLPKLLIGFNRRFSSHVINLKDKLKNRISPLYINFRINALKIPYTNWVHNEEGGGRNLGEACHFYDLVCYITNSNVAEVGAISTPNLYSADISSDNFMVLLKFEDGSIANINYTSQGSSLVAKEYLEVFFDDKTFIIDDFKSSKYFYNGTIDVLKTKFQDKGHEKILNQYIEDLKKNKWTIPLEDQLKATRISFLVEKMI